MRNAAMQKDKNWPRTGTRDANDETITTKSNAPNEILAVVQFVAIHNATPNTNAAAAQTPKPIQKGMFGLKKRSIIPGWSRCEVDSPEAVFPPYPGGQACKFSQF